MKKVSNLDFSFLCGADRQGNLWIEYNPQFSLEPKLTHCSNQDLSWKAGVTVTVFQRPGGV